MTITLELKPQTEARLAELAAARGVTTEAYLQSLVESVAGETNAQSYVDAPYEEWKRAFREWFEMPRPYAPPLSDEAISRESIYEREDHQL